MARRPYVDLWGCKVVVGVQDFNVCNYNACFAEKDGWVGHCMAVFLLNSYGRRLVRGDLHIR